MKPTLLITNDDGINELGLMHLVNALKPYFSITVVAPEIQQSGKSVGITLFQPLKIQKSHRFDGVDAYHVSGTPADCVKMAMSRILQQPCSLVVSGINPGDNSGRNALYSGTVGATIESTLRGTPGIAFSCLDFDEPPYEEFATYIPEICRYFIDNPPPFGTIINVNCPSRQAGSIRGVRLAKQGKSYWIENQAALQNAPIFDVDHYLGASWQEHIEHEESDIALLKKGFITAAAIKVDELTDHRYFDHAKDNFNHRFVKNGVFSI